MRRLLAIGGLVLAAAAPLVPAATAAAAEPATAANFEVMLVVDTSGSMQGAPIQTARTAAQQFVAQMPADVRIGVESFGRTITVLTAPTTDRAVISQSIDALATGGNTPLHDAVIAATQSYTPAAEYKALVLLSDGGDRGSRATLTDAVASVSGMHVEAISLTTSTTDLLALQALGSVTPADNAAALPAAFTRVGDLLTKVIATTVPPSTQPPRRRGADDRRHHEGAGDDPAIGVGTAHDLARARPVRLPTCRSTSGRAGVPRPLRADHAGLPSCEGEPPAPRYRAPALTVRSGQAGGFGRRRAAQAPTAGAPRWPPRSRSPRSPCSRASS